MANVAQRMISLEETVEVLELRGDHSVRNIIYLYLY